MYAMRTCIVDLIRGLFTITADDWATFREAGQLELRIALWTHEVRVPVDHLVLA